MSWCQCALITVNFHIGAGREPIQRYREFQIALIDLEMYIYLSLFFWLSGNKQFCLIHADYMMLFIMADEISHKITAVQLLPFKLHNEFHITWWNMCFPSVQFMYLEQNKGTPVISDLFYKKTEMNSINICHWATAVNISRHNNP